MNEKVIIERVAWSVFTGSGLYLGEDEKFVPPDAAQNAAKKALRWKDEHGDEVKAMTPTGWARARQLAKGESLSYDIVKRMAQFNRHRKNSEIAPEHKGEPWKDNGYVAWLGWGGTAGIDWAISVVERMEKKRQSSIAERVAARGLQVRRKDKDLMRDTGGVSKGRDREPDSKPPRDDRRERYRDRRLKPEQIDKDTNQHKDRPVKKPNRRPQAALTDEEVSAVSDAVKKEVGGQKKHKLRVFDFDDTLVSSESSVKVKHADGETTDLDSAAFAYFTPSGGDKIDFSDFNHVTKPRLIKKGMDALRDAVGDGEARTVILTARPKGSASAVKKFLEGQGVKGVDVVALQSSDPMDKARWIEKNMEGVDDIEFTDDSSKNVEAVKTLQGKTKRFQMNNPSHPTESDYEGKTIQDVFKSDAPTTVEVEKGGPKAPSSWWRGQTKEFQRQYCKTHPESKYCGG